MQPNTGNQRIGKPEWLRPYQWLTVLTALLVLLQPVLAGQWLFKGDADLLDAHGVVANILFLVVIVQTVLTYMIRFAGRLGQQMLLLNGLLVVLTVVQIGLGYSGSDSADAIAWHIPLGVLIFGLAVAIASLATRPSDV